MRLLVAGGGTVLLFVSVIVHELGHVVMARRRRVAVDGISVFLLGGYSEIELDDVPPSVEIAVAVAGSLASVFLALVLGGVAVALPDVGGLARVASVLMLVNAAVAVFNLLPGLPLDGGHVVRGCCGRSVGADSAPSGPQRSSASESAHRSPLSDSSHHGRDDRCLWSLPPRGCCSSFSA